MPNIKSAVKRVKLTRIRTARNTAARSALKTSIKRFERALHGADAEKVQLEMRKAVKTVDQGVAKGIIHKNNAARKKSRIDRKAHALQQNQS